MAKATYVYVTHWHSAPKGHASYQKYHLKKMAPNINGISQKEHLVFWNSNNTLLIEPNPTNRRKLEKHDFKIPWPWVWTIQQI